MKKRIKFGLIGCGRISAKHIKVLANLCDEAELVCLCDIDIKRAQNRAREYSKLVKIGKGNSEIDIPSVYSDLEEMLKNEKINILSICTPSGLHPKHGIKAARMGINVLTEKPMAIDLKSADKLIETCKKAKVKLFVVKQNRLNQTIIHLKNAIEQKRFGKIYLIIANVLWFRPQEYYDQDGWRGTKELDGGVFMNQAIHYIDAMAWLVGPAKSVLAHSSKLARKIESEDTGFAAIEFKSGAVGSLNVTVLAYPENLEGSITIFGEKGVAKIGGSALNKIERWEFDEKRKGDGALVNFGYEIADVYGMGHYDFYKNVIDVLTKGSKSFVDGAEGRVSLKLVLAIYKSSKLNKRIYL